MYICPWVWSGQVRVGVRACAQSLATVTVAACSEARPALGSSSLVKIQMRFKSLAFESYVCMYVCMCVCTILIGTSECIVYGMHMVVRKEITSDFGCDVCGNAVLSECGVT